MPGDRAGRQRPASATDGGSGNLSGLLSTLTPHLRRGQPATVIHATWGSPRLSWLQQYLSCTGPAPSAAGVRCTLGGGRLVGTVRGRTDEFVGAIVALVSCLSSGGSACAAECGDAPAPAAAYTVLCDPALARLPTAHVLALAQHKLAQPELALPRLVGHRAVQTASTFSERAGASGSIQRFVAGQPGRCADALWHLSREATVDQVRQGLMALPQLQWTVGRKPVALGDVAPYMSFSVLDSVTANHVFLQLGWLYDGVDRPQRPAHERLGGWIYVGLRLGLAKDAARERGAAALLLPDIWAASYAQAPSPPLD